MSHKPWPIEQRFWKKVRKTKSCWIWTGNRTMDGYGKFMVASGQQMTTAHRVSWMLCRGAIPKGMFVLHHCDNPPCVNPAHLFVGTHQDNMDDCAAKGRKRNGWLSGEAHPMTKLTKDEVVAIRERYALGHRQMALAAAFGVSDTQIRNIVRRISWRHIP